MAFLKYYKQTWHRNILENLLKNNSHLIKGNILDIGSKNRRYDHLFQDQITAIDLNPNKDKKIIFGNLEQKLDFPADSFNSLLCLEVLEYLNSPLANSSKEIHRLLSQNGCALISIPFFYHDHQDNIRFTEKFIYNNFKQFSSIKIIKIGNGWTAIWDILRKKIFKNRSSSIKKIIFPLLLPIFIFIKLLRLDKIEDNYYSGLFIIIKK